MCMDLTLHTACQGANRLVYYQDHYSSEALHSSLYYHCYWNRYFKKLILKMEPIIENYYPETRTTDVDPRLCKKKNSLFIMKFLETYYWPALMHRYSTMVKKI